MREQRRNFIIYSGLGLGAVALPSLLFAQDSGPIKIGVLIPLTGSTSQFGATMSKAASLAAQEINAAGGVLGRKVEIVIEDDQSNPEAAVRAVRKMIDLDKVVAVCGSYASAVTSAIAPICWESKITLLTASGADSITKLPHQGYIFRTSPTVTLQGTRLGNFAVELNAKKVFFMGPQTPFAKSYIDIITGIVTKAGGTCGGLIYEDKKTTYRTEVDQALKAQPDIIVLGGYVPDTAVVLKDLYRANYSGKRMGLSFGVNQKLIDGVQKEVLEGTYSLVPSAAVSSQAYKNLIAKMHLDGLDTYSCQVYDQINLVALAIAQGKIATGVGVRDNIRSVSQVASPSQQAPIVENFPDGAKLIAAKRVINYDGASGPCEFAENGDVKGVFFRYEQIQAGKLVTIKVA
ncbi:ABC transporter substrate-binding protein [Glaciimonas sp. PCH181]|uniref:ABC transporter substrate-binding protein n=1 Tax=Glaciimonas sp. PCH181 TaxID=2133943 RepID=UPI000D3A4EC8|nr:ABC transporter substrate-binding protein [Glaciimonas sp. PCH181]PUA17695.1 ABC transporter substrate-binding protein [Glaciimonas sp. PCH181]